MWVTALLLVRRAHAVNDTIGCRVWQSVNKNQPTLPPIYIDPVWFRALHRTETAFFRVTSDLLLEANRRESAILIILDLSTAFDTVDHAILLDHLKTWVGIKDTSWFYLSGRTFSVTTGNYSSAHYLWCTARFCFRSSFIFYSYALPLGQVVEHHNVSFHCYADNIQRYLPLRPGDPRSLAAVLDCLKDINCWMAQNFVQLNNRNHTVQPPKQYQPLSASPWSSVGQHKTHCTKSWCSIWFRAHIDNNAALWQRKKIYEALGYIYFFTRIQNTSFVSLQPHSFYPQY